MPCYIIIIIIYTYCSSRSIFFSSTVVVAVFLVTCLFCIIYYYIAFVYIIRMSSCCYFINATAATDNQCRSNPCQTGRAAAATTTRVYACRRTRFLYLDNNISTAYRLWASERATVEYCVWRCPDVEECIIGTPCGIWIRNEKWRALGETTYLASGFRRTPELRYLCVSAMVVVLENPSG